MNTEISPQSAYSDVYASLGTDQYWKNVPNDVEVNIVCRIGSVYDPERQSCIEGYQKLFRSFDRGTDTLNFAYDQNYYPDVLTVEFWVFPESVSSYTIVYKHTSYIELGFAAGELRLTLSSSPSTQCKTTSVTISQNTWYHIAYAYDRLDKSAGIYLNGAEAKNCASNSLGAMSVPAIGNIIALLGSGANSLFGFANELRVWNERRVLDQIKYNYRRRLYDENLSSLIWVWRFNEGIGKVIHEFSKINPKTITLANDVEWNIEILPVPLCGSECYFDGVHCKCIF